MTLIQGQQIAQLAKQKGFAVRAEKGLVQLVTVTYNAAGKSTVKECSGWMDYEHAMAFVGSTK